MLTMTADDTRYMARAIQLARKGLYTTHPNPRVGCVLVRDKKIVGEGFHRRAGEPHAERNALADAGSRAYGSTAYVTLEPCCHQGRTPPCTDGLIQAGIKRVVMAMLDPNPLVAGKGMKQLVEAGMSVDTAVLEPQARALNPGYIKRLVEKMPYVRCKLAMSLDGRTAMASGESKWITGDAARQDVQRLRARSSAIMTGVGTVVADNPAMNVRISFPGLSNGDSGASLPQPLRVVLDPLLKIPPEARILQTPGKCLVVSSVESDAKAARLRAAGAELVTLDGTDDRIALKPLLKYLATREINELLIESGATLAGAALAAGLIDELVIYTAPHIMGDTARGLFHLPGLEEMKQRIQLEIKELRMVGQDIRIIATPTSNNFIATIRPI